jgi:putative DNA primase/helicase
MHLLEKALEYARAGKPVFPCWPGTKKPIGELCPHGFKDATTDEHQIHERWSKYPDANIGMPTGPVSGIDVLDTDPRHGGDKTLAKLIVEHSPLPLTLQVRSGGGGTHHYFRARADLRCRDGKDKSPGVDVKTEGGYVLVPPSRLESYVDAKGERQSGGVYSFINREALAEWPQWILEVLDLYRSPEPEPAAETVGGKIRHPHRHPHLLSLAGTMRKRGMADAAILAALRAENQAVCEPPLPDAEVTKIAAGIKRYPAGEAEISEEPSSGQGSPPLVALSLEEFLAHKFPPREPILAPWLVRQSLVMIYAWRSGKDLFRP